MERILCARRLLVSYAECGVRFCFVSVGPCKPPRRALGIVVSAVPAGKKETDHVIKQAANVRRGKATIYHPEGGVSKGRFAPHHDAGELTWWPIVSGERRAGQTAEVIEGLGYTIHQ